MCMLASMCVYVCMCARQDKRAAPSYEPTGCRHKGAQEKQRFGYSAGSRAKARGFRTKVDHTAHTSIMIIADRE